MIGSEAIQEKGILLSSNIQLISGGNTDKLLYYLRRLGLDKAIIQFWEKGGVVLSGFSAGAIVLTPSVETATTGVDEREELGLTDLRGLGIVPFHVWPHYDASQYAELQEYRSKHNVEVRTIGDEECLVVE